MATGTKAAWAAVIASMFALAISGGAVAQVPAPPTAPEPSMGDPLPDRLVAMPNGVTVNADIVFSTVPGFRPIILDLYTAPGGASEKGRPPQRPLVVYIHGGGWAGGHTRQSGAFSDFPGVLADLAARGFAVASLEYRLSGEAPFPAAIDDVKTAIRFLRANAVRFGIDPSRVALWGGSAGGHLAALAAVSCGGGPTGADKSNPSVSDCVQGAVSWYGIHDIAAMPPRPVPSAESRFLDCGSTACPADRVAAASPVNFVDAKDPPMLLMHGSKDVVVPVNQSELFAARLRAARVPVELEIIPDVGHSWVGADPAATRAASLRALDRTFRFFEAQLKGGR